MNGKKRTALILALALAITSVMLGACAKEKTEDTKKENHAAKVKSKIEAYRTDLTDSRDGLKSNEDILLHLRAWAKSKSVDADVDKSGNVIMTAKASKEYEGAVPTVIVCPFDYKEFDNYIEPMALALYCIKNNEKTGDLTVIFAAESAHTFTGARSLNKDHFKGNPKVICLNGGSKGKFSMNTGGSTVFRFKQKISKTSPKLAKAYSITITGVPEGQVSAEKDVLNPIIRLKSLMESMKASNIAYEIASFSGGNDDDLAPTSATMTLVVDGDKEERFIDKMDDTISDFNDKYKKTYPNVSYSYAETAMPARVLDQDSAVSFTSFLYTLLDGVYAEDDDGNPIALNEITRIVLGKNKVYFNSAAYSLDSEVLSEIEIGEKSLCQLSGVSYEKLKTVPIWNGREDSVLKEDLAKAYKKFTDKKLTYKDSVISTTAGYISQLDPNLDIVAVTVSKNIVNDVTGSIIQYLLDSAPSEEE